MTSRRPLSNRHGLTLIEVLLVVGVLVVIASLASPSLLRMMETPAGFTGPVNIGNPVEFTMLELAEKVLAQVRGRSQLAFKPLPSDDPRQRQPDIAVARDKLGWEPRVGLDDGLRETIAYFRQLLAA